ncbi:hypothetical protein [Arthrobacter sp. KNU40]|uniref:hypothetical protein n=1 Tax=Arthrobacter sp. KNU40 TaxID=3447965 RepID=UPI003F5F3386
MEQTAPAPAAPQPAAPINCPSGLLNATLSSVSFAPYKYDANESTIIARGVLRNDTTAEVLLGDNDVPNFLGLDAQGKPVVIELFGEWDWAPPPGTPRMGFLTIKPGQSLAYTVTKTFPNEMIAQVKFWYSAAEVGSLDATFNNGQFLRCRNPLAPAGQGQSIPATNLPPTK